MRKFIVGAAVALAGIAGGAAAGGVADAGVTGCYSSSSGSSAWSYCEYSASNSLRHRVRATCSDGRQLYGTYRNGGMASSVSCAPAVVVGHSYYLG